MTMLPEFSWWGRRAADWWADVTGTEYSMARTAIADGWAAGRIPGGVAADMMAAVDQAEADGDDEGALVIAEWARTYAVDEPQRDPDPVTGALEGVGQLAGEAGAAVANQVAQGAREFVRALPPWLLGGAAILLLVVVAGNVAELIRAARGRP